MVVRTLWSLVILALCAGLARGSGQGLPSQGGASAEGLVASPEPGWPQWRGPRRDGVSDEQGLLPSWPEGGPKRLWKIDGLGKGWSSPIIVNGSIYITGDVGDDLVVFAFDCNGAAQWRATNGKAWKGPYPGARACSAFSGKRLYHLNAYGRLACLDAGSGKEIWAVDVLERFDAKNITWALSECLLVDGDHVIVTPGGTKALMAALDAGDGHTLWTTAPLAEDRTSHCSPILLRYGGRRIVTNCSSAHGFGVDADTGRLLWTVPLKNPYGTNVATPVYDAGRVFYMTPYAEQGRQYRLHTDTAGITAELAWSSPIDAVTGGAVLAHGTLFAAGYEKSKWWFAIDWITGQTKYELKDLKTGAAIYADGRLYCLDEQGTAALLKSGSAGLEVTGRFQLADPGIKDAWAHPVLLDGRLYLRYHDSLYCHLVKR
jgi:outer membrane protein assembly factor BamB